MSFGYSVGDSTLLSHLAWKAVQEAKRAYGEHDPLTREVITLHKVLEALDTQHADPSSAFNTADDARKQDLVEIYSGTRETLEILNSICIKYNAANALAEGNRQPKKLWKKIKFGNGEMVDMEDIRLKLSTYTSAISLFLNLISLDSQGRVESLRNSQLAELGEIRKPIELHMAKMNAQAPGSSVDDKSFWKELRRELVREGYTSSALNKNKQVIQEYLKELGQRGVFDDSEDVFQEKLDLRELINDGKAAEGAASENGSFSNEIETGWVEENDQGKTHTLVEEPSEAGEDILEHERNYAEKYLSKDKNQNRAGGEQSRGPVHRGGRIRIPLLTPPPYPTPSLADEATFTTDEKRGSEVIQDRYEQKVEQYLATCDDSDLASIVSYAPSELSEDSSTSSFSSNPSRGSEGKMLSAALEGVEYILAEPFLSDTAFGPAYVVAIENIGVDRFRRNLTRLLDRYSSSLRKEAEGWLEVNTSRVLRTRVPSIVSVIADASSGLMLANRAVKDAAAARIELLLQKQRLKEHISAIADIVDGNGNDPEEIEEPPDEDVMPRLKEAKHFMALSQAFRRFQEDLRIFAFPIMSLYIRTIIRSSSRSIQDKGTIHIRCQVRWEILEFCEKELQGYTDLMPLLTLTGTPTSAQADTCEEYVKETWGSAGSELLNRFVLGLRTKSCDAFLAEGRYVHIDFHPKNQEHPEMASIHLTGNLDQIVEILEQLSWFAASFRTSSRSQLTMSHAIFQERPGKLKFEKGEPEFELSLVSPRYHSISVNPNEKLEQSNCWLPLFSAGILAQGFPIRQRPEAALGLDVAFPVLALLARLDGPMSYAEGIVFSGKSSILFPSRLLGAGRDGVQWHFVGVDDPASTVDILEQSDWVQSRDLEQLITSRAFLGYCRYAHVLAGTKELLEISQIGESCIRRSTSRLEIRPEVNISTAFTAKGVWNATLETKVVLSKGLRAQIGDDEIDFRDRVHRTVKAPVLVFDTATQSAWLIPETSLILHMVHEYLKQDWVQTPRGSEVILPYAQMSPDGGEAAFNAIVDHGHQELWKRQEDGKVKRFMDVVNDYLKLFDIIRKEINMKKAAAGRTLRQPRLLGWDFMDILAKEHLFFERELPADMGSRMSWWELALNTDTLVIFGSNFGQLIRADLDKSSVCKAWSPIPENFNLLTASARCILNLARKCDARDNSCRRVADGLEWHTPKGSYLYGDPCVQPRCETCILIQELRAPQKRLWQRHGKNSDVGESVELDGALIFGSVDHYHKLLKRRRQTLVNRTISNPPPGPSNTTTISSNTQSSPAVSNIPIGGVATIRTISISNSGARQPQVNRTRTEIPLYTYHEPLLSSSLGHSSGNQPVLHIRGEQNQVPDQTQTA